MHEYHILTPLGAMLATANQDALYSLEFTDAPCRDNETILPAPIKMLIKELADYFAGRLKVFKTPLVLEGTNFQKNTWQALMRIPYGVTISYAELSTNIGNPTAFRAAANANGKNKFPIIVPCHRVINSNGKLGGYSSGLERKIWLLKHEGIEIAN